MQLRTKAINLDLSETEICLNILRKSAEYSNRDEITTVTNFFRKFEFFTKIPYRLVEIKEQEIGNLIEKCLKYMKVITFRPQEMVIERGRKVEYVYFVARGKVGIFEPKTPKEIEKEMEELIKAHQEQIKLQIVSSKKNMQPESKKINFDSLRKLQYQKFTSLAKEKTEKSHLKSEISKVKEIEEVAAGYHLFENSIRTQVIAENTIIAKEQSDLVVMRAIDYHRAIRNLNNMYQNRLRLLQKSFLTAECSCYD